MDERIVELETRLAFQEQSIQTLNETVIEQARQIERLSGELEALKQRMRAIAPSIIATEAEETPPPHY